MLINIVSGIQRKSIEDVVEDVSRFNNYRDFKDYVSEVIIEELKGPRTEFEKYINEPWKTICIKSSKQAREKREKKQQKYLLWPTFFKVIENIKSF
ncbi:CBK_G0011300.mRNA.1.CDS.1 [Saccharomyces cerevisiae]|nr:CBK_G0011300.mRNA.1.CDS.1 [Saccharomyces cerevisiae]CAI7214023.1 CBK_G0011300.mRNA.1.CDS.1 [Saccharomyces cerevisiae]